MVCGFNYAVCEKEIETTFVKVLANSNCLE